MTTCVLFVTALCNSSFYGFIAVVCCVKYLLYMLCEEAVHRPPKEFVYSSGKDLLW